MRCNSKRRPLFYFHLCSQVTITLIFIQITMLSISVDSEISPRKLSYHKYTYINILVHILYVRAKEKLSVRRLYNYVCSTESVCVS